MLNSKKIISLLFVFIILYLNLIPPITAKSINNLNDDLFSSNFSKTIKGEILSRKVIEILPDGSYIIETIIKHTPETSSFNLNSFTLSSLNSNTVTYTKSYEHTPRGGKSGPIASLTATFSYNGYDQVKCTSKSSSYSNPSSFSNESFSESEGLFNSHSLTVNLKYTFNGFIKSDHTISPYNFN
ncbi:MAG: hypothetical protein N2Z57_02435 [Oscillospiraceae bacterium]|nr:hypothetical protein [Oscillospiraceae bacterium]